MNRDIRSCNTILYCRKWKETVEFYRKRLGLPIHFLADWFVEFELGAGCRLSIADERRASIESGGGRGITLAWQVEDVERERETAVRAGLDPTEIVRHPWNARLFHLRDPEGNRIEIWEAEDPADRLETTGTPDSPHR